MSWPKRLLAWADGTTLRTRVLWLGLFCWVVTVLLPSIHRFAYLGADALALLGLAPALLGAGLWLSANHPGASAYTLLAGFPIALALSMSRFEPELSLATYTPAPLLFALASLAAYAAAASQLCCAHEQKRSVDHKPLGEVSPVDPELRKQQVGALVLGSVTLGAIALLVWSSWQSPAAYRQQWGRAAADGAVLTALAAGLLGTAAVALVAPGLRAERKHRRPRQTGLKRAARPLLAALSFMLLYWLMRATR
jgi:hypothetical protein